MTEIFLAFDAFSYVRGGLMKKGIIGMILAAVLLCSVPSGGQRMENPLAVPDMDIVWKRFRSSW